MSGFLRPIIYNLKDGDSEKLPIDDGTFTIKGMSELFSSGWFVIAFYDAYGQTVTPTAGTITPLAITIAGQFQEPSNGDTSIDAIGVIADSDGTATYDIPCFSGPMIGGQVTFADIAGADHAKAYFWRG